MDGNLRRVGPTAWTAEEMAFAEKLQKTLAGKNLPALSSAKEIRKYQFNGQKYSSTDSGDVSWVTPLATLIRRPGFPEQRPIPGRPRLPVV